MSFPSSLSVLLVEKIEVSSDLSVLLEIFFPELVLRKHLFLGLKLVDSCLQLVKFLEQGCRMMGAIT